MATRTIGFAYDGYVELNQNDLTPGGSTTAVNDGWAACRNSATGSYTRENTIYDPDAVTVRKWSSAGDGRFQIQRAFFTCNSVGQLYGECVTSAKLRIYGTTYGSGDLVVVKSNNPWPGGTLSTSSFNIIDGWNSSFGPDDLTVYSSEITSWSTSGYNEITLNSRAMRDLEKTGGTDFFHICLMEYDHDYLGVEPFEGSASGLLANGNYWYYSTDAHPTTYQAFWPEIVCETTSGPCGYGNDVNAVVTANIDKIIGVSTADIEKVIGS